uniref:centrosome-associated protein CEP250-like n=1 Tax=Agelaius phoeniceus TaxID=39638 RepID=UPI0023EB5A00|nr:centrosome-associated protein CEP250-like [Agelaius phoeniceus]
MVELRGRRAGGGSSTSGRALSRGGAACNLSPGFCRSFSPVPEQALAAAAPPTATGASTGAGMVGKFMKRMREEETSGTGTVLRAYPPIFKTKTSAALLDMLVEEGPSSPKQVPAMVRYIQQWLTANKFPDYNLYRPLLDLTEALPTDVATVVMWKILQMPCVAHVVTVHFPCLFMHLLFQVLFSTLDMTEILDCLDLSECRDSVLEVMSKNLQSQCREMYGLALRGLLVLGTSLSAIRRWSLHERLVELLQENDSDMLRMTMVLLSGLFLCNGAPIASPLALQLAGALLPLFDNACAQVGVKQPMPRSLFLSFIQDDSQVQLCSMFIFREMLYFLPEGDKKSMKSYMHQSLLPLFFHCHDENQRMAEASRETLHCSATFLHRKDLQHMLRLDQTWRFGEGLGARGLSHQGRSSRAPQVLVDDGDSMGNSIICTDNPGNILSTLTSTDEQHPFDLAREATENCERMWQQFDQVEERTQRIRSQYQIIDSLLEEICSDCAKIEKSKEMLLQCTGIPETGAFCLQQQNTKQQKEASAQAEEAEQQDWMEVSEEEESSSWSLELLSQESSGQGHEVAQAWREEELLAQKADLEGRLAASEGLRQDLARQLEETRSAKESLQSRLFAAQQQMAQLQITWKRVEAELQGELQEARREAQAAQRRHEEELQGLKEEMHLLLEQREALEKQLKVGWVLVNLRELARDSLALGCCSCYLDVLILSLEEKKVCLRTLEEQNLALHNQVSQCQSALQETEQLYSEHRRELLGLNTQAWALLEAVKEKAAFLETRQKQLETEESELLVRLQSSEEISVDIATQCKAMELELRKRQAQRDNLRARNKELLKQLEQSEQAMLRAEHQKISHENSQKQDAIALKEDVLTLCPSLQRNLEDLEKERKDVLVSEEEESSSWSLELLSQESSGQGHEVAQAWREEELLAQKADLEGRLAATEWLRQDLARQLEETRSAKESLQSRLFAAQQQMAQLEMTWKRVEAELQGELQGACREAQAAQRRHEEELQGLKEEMHLLLEQREALEKQLKVGWVLVNLRELARDSLALGCCSCYLDVLILSLEEKKVCLRTLEEQNLALHNQVSQCQSALQETEQLYSEHRRELLGLNTQAWALLEAVKEKAAFLETRQKQLETEESELLVRLQSSEEISVDIATQCKAMELELRKRQAQRDNLRARNKELLKQLEQSEQAMLRAEHQKISHENSQKQDAIALKEDVLTLCPSLQRNLEDLEKERKDVLVSEEEESSSWSLELLSQESSGQGHEVAQAWREEELLAQKADLESRLAATEWLRQDLARQLEETRSAKESLQSRLFAAQQQMAQLEMTWKRVEAELQGELQGARREAQAAQRRHEEELQGLKEEMHLLLEQREALEKQLKVGWVLVNLRELARDSLALGCCSCYLDVLILSLEEKKVCLRTLEEQNLALHNQVSQCQSALQETEQLYSEHRRELLGLNTQAWALLEAVKEKAAFLETRQKQLETEESELLVRLQSSEEISVDIATQCKAMELELRKRQAQRDNLRARNKELLKQLEQSEQAMLRAEHQKISHENSQKQDAIALKEDVLTLCPSLQRNLEDLEKERKDVLVSEEEESSSWSLELLSQESSGQGHEVAQAWREEELLAQKADLEGRLAATEWLRQDLARQLEETRSAKESLQSRLFAAQQQMAQLEMTWKRVEAELQGELQGARREAQAAQRRHKEELQGLKEERNLLLEQREALEKQLKVGWVLVNLRELARDSLALGCCSCYLDVLILSLEEKKVCLRTLEEQNLALNNQVSQCQSALQETEQLYSEHRRELLGLNTQAWALLEAVKEKAAFLETRQKQLETEESELRVRLQSSEEISVDIATQCKAVELELRKRQAQRDNLRARNKELLKQLEQSEQAMLRAEHQKISLENSQKKDAIAVKEEDVVLRHSLENELQSLQEERKDVLHERELYQQQMRYLEKKNQMHAPEMSNHKGNNQELQVEREEFQEDLEHEAAALKKSRDKTQVLSAALNKSELAKGVLKQHLDILQEKIPADTGIVLQSTPVSLNYSSDFSHEEVSKEEESSSWCLEQLSQESSGQGHEVAQAWREEELLAQKADLEGRLAATEWLRQDLARQLEETRSAKESLQSRLFAAQQQISQLEITRNHLEARVLTVTQDKVVIEGEVKCLQGELEAARALRRQEQEDTAQQLLQAEQQPQESLRLQGTAQQLEIKKLLQDLASERERHRAEMEETLEQWEKEKAEREQEHKKVLFEMRQKVATLLAQQEELKRFENAKQEMFMAKVLLEEQKEKNALSEALLQTQGELSRARQQVQQLRQETIKANLQDELQGARREAQAAQRRHEEELQGLKEERNLLLEQREALEKQLKVGWVLVNLRELARDSLALGCCSSYLDVLILSLEEKNVCLRTLEEQNSALNNQVSQCQSALQQAEQLSSNRAGQLRELNTQIRALQDAVLQMEASQATQQKQLLKELEESRAGERSLRDSVHVLQAEVSELRVRLQSSDDKALALAIQCEAVELELRKTQAQRDNLKAHNLELQKELDESEQDWWKEEVKHISRESALEKEATERQEEAVALRQEVASLKKKLEILEKQRKDVLHERELYQQQMRYMEKKNQMRALNMQSQQERMQHLDSEKQAMQEELKHGTAALKEGRGSTLSAALNKCKIARGSLKKHLGSLKGKTCIQAGRDVDLQSTPVSLKYSSDVSPEEVDPERRRIRTFRRVFPPDYFILPVPESEIEESSSISEEQQPSY